MEADSDASYHVEKRLGEMYPERIAEIRSILDFVDSSFVQSPPLFVYGPTGTGKTKICTAILDSLSIPYAKVVCSGYSNVKQVFPSIFLFQYKVFV